MSDIYERARKSVGQAYSSSANQMMALITESCLLVLSLMSLVMILILHLEHHYVLPKVIMKLPLHFTAHLSWDSLFCFLPALRHSEGVFRSSRLVSLSSIGL